MYANVCKQLLVKNRLKDRINRKWTNFLFLVFWFNAFFLEKNFIYQRAIKKSLKKLFFVVASVCKNKLGFQFFKETTDVDINEIITLFGEIPLFWVIWRIWAIHSGITRYQYWVNNINTVEKLAPDTRVYS